MANGSSVSKSNADLNSFVLIKPRLAIPWTNMLCFKNLQMLWILVEGNNVSSVNKERKLLNLFERKAYGILFIIFRSPLSPFIFLNGRLLDETIASASSG